ncbi:MAG: hypothetical protein WCA58_05885, partial [Terriglobales bacterium]
ERRAAAAAKLGGGIVLSSTLVAEEGCVHGGQYTSFAGRCKGVCSDAIVETPRFACAAVYRFSRFRARGRKRFSSKAFV